MPWQEKSPVDLRRNLVEDYLTEAWTMAELCAAYGVSPKTAYKWLARFEANGVSGLTGIGRGGRTRSRTR